MASALACKSFAGASLRSAVPTAGKVSSRPLSVPSAIAASHRLWLNCLLRAQGLALHTIALSGGVGWTADTERGLQEGRLEAKGVASIVSEPFY